MTVTFPRVIRTSTLSAFFLVVGPATVLGSASWADIDLATANLRNQVLQDQLASLSTHASPSHRSLYAPMPSTRWQDDFARSPLAQRISQLREASTQPRQPQQPVSALAEQLGERLAASTQPRQPQQTVSALAEQLELASQRLAAQQKLATLELQEAKMFDDLRASGAPVDAQRLHSAPALPDLALSQVDAQRLPSAPASPDLALSQTGVQAQRYEHPALAALLMEPAVYGYYLIAWAALAICTGISSAICMYTGKLPCSLCRRAEQPEQLPIASITGRSRRSDSSRQATYFQYPGSSCNYAARPNGVVSKKLDLEPDEEPDGVETWIRVPARSAGQRQASYAGYIDESDGEQEVFVKPARGRHQWRGYADEC